MDFKRGDYVEVTLRGKIVNSGDGTTRISVEGITPSWWAVVPTERVEYVRPDWLQVKED